MLVGSRLNALKLRSLIMSLKTKYRYTSLLTLVLAIISSVILVTLDIKGLFLVVIIVFTAIAYLSSLLMIISSFTKNPHKTLFDLIFFGF